MTRIRSALDLFTALLPVIAAAGFIVIHMSWRF